MSQLFWFAFFPAFHSDNNKYSEYFASENEKIILLFWLFYNDIESLGFILICCLFSSLLFILAVCISTTLFPCTCLLHTALAFSCDFHPVTALPLLVFHPILYQFPAAIFSAWCLCGHFCMQRRNWTGSLLNPRVPSFIFQDILIQIEKKLDFYNST